MSPKYLNYTVMIVTRLTKYILWPASLLYWSITMTEYFNTSEAQQIQFEKQLTSKLSVTNTAESPSKNNKSISDLLGLFGKPETQVPKIVMPTNRVISTTPTSLQGIFIENSKAWAIINSKNNQTLIIQPEQIKSFNRTSITIETAAGIQSLHLQRDTKGINIYASSKVTSNDTTVIKKEPSRAELLKIKLLNRAKTADQQKGH